MQLGGGVGECWENIGYPDVWNDTAITLRQVVAQYCGSTCPIFADSRDPTSRDNDFFPQLLKKADGLSPEESRSLSESYRSVIQLPSRAEADVLGKKLEARSTAEPKLADWLLYVRGALALHSWQQEDAAVLFGKLADTAKLPELREAGYYLVGRSWLLASQKDWSGFENDRYKIRSELVAKAETAFKSYLEKYPQGQFRQSAAGLLDRKIAFLEGKDSELIKALSTGMETAALAHDPQASRLATELDSNLLYRYSGEKIPLDFPLTAVAGMIQTMRELPKKPQLPKDALSHLEAAKARYERFPGSFELMKSGLHLLRGEYEQTVEVPYRLKTGTPLAASHAKIRALAFEKLGKWSEARSEWKKTAFEEKHNEATELSWRIYPLLDLLSEAKLQEAPALSSDNDKKATAEVFYRAAGEKDLLAVASSTSAKPEVRELASQALLDGYLLAERYQDFLKELESSPVRRKYEGVETAIRSLSQTPDDPKGLLNLGYYLQTSGTSPARFQVCSSSHSNVQTQMQWNKPGWKHDFPSRIPEDAFALYDRGIRVFEKSQAAANPKDETGAKLIYHYLRCFRESNDSDSCFFNGDSYDRRQKIPVERRRKLFRLLKSKFPKSRWARQLTTYW